MNQDLRSFVLTILDDDHGIKEDACGLIELEIHTHLEQVLGMDPMSDECFRIADEALSVAGILLGFGPDEL